MRAIRLLATLAMLASLAACTGTFEETEPLLLVAGVNDASGNPQVVLIEDRFSPVQSTQDRLAVIDASRRALTYPAVDADVTDRNGLRSELVLLARELDTAVPRSELRFYSLDGIDPTDPVAFAASPEHPTVALTGTPGGLLDTYSGGPGTCPTSLQASQDGRYVAVLDDRSVCSGVSSDLVTLYLIDVAGPQPSVVFTSGAQPVLPAKPYLDQASPDEHLYYLVRGINSMQVYRMTLPNGSSGPYLGLSLPGTDGTVLRADRDVLVSLGSSQLRSIALTSGATANSVGTVDDSRVLAVDDTGTTSQVLVVGQDRTFVHADPSDASPAQLLNLYGRAAVIDPLNRFAYVMRDGVMYIIDLLAVAGGSSGNLSLGTPLPELILPTENGHAVGVLEWTRAVSPPTP